MNVNGTEKCRSHDTLPSFGATTESGGAPRGCCLTSRQLVTCWSPEAATQDQTSLLITLIYSSQMPAHPALGFLASPAANYESHRSRCIRQKHHLCLYIHRLYYARAQLVHLDLPGTSYIVAVAGFTHVPRSMPLISSNTYPGPSWIRASLKGRNKIE